MANVFLESSNSTYHEANNNTKLYGLAGDQMVTIAEGVSSLVFDQNIESIVFSGAASDYQFQQAGNMIKVFSADGATQLAQLTVQSDGSEIRFSDAYADLTLANGVMALGGATVSSTKSALTITSSVEASSGVVIDGYISGSSVFADHNGDGIQNAGEAFATTDEEGGYTLLGGSGSIIASGGIDVSTGLAFEGIFSAPAGSSTISPLTTLVDQVMQTSSTTVTAEQAVAQVAQALGLSQDVDLLTFDPIAAASDETQSDIAVAIQAAAIQVNNMMIQSAAMLSGAGVSDEAAGSTAAAAALASMIATSSATATPTIDLTSAAFVQTFLETSAQEAGASTEQLATIAEVSQDIAQSTANINLVMQDTIENAPTGASAETIFADLAQVQVAADDIADLASTAAETGDTTAVTEASDVTAIEETAAEVELPTDTTTEEPVVEEPTTPTTPTTPSTGGGTTTPAATTQTVAVSATGSSDASSLASTYNFTAGTYAYTIAGFNDGDILNFEDTMTPTIINTSATDGSVSVQWAYSGDVISVTLTGISTTDDGSIFSVSSFESTFGASSLA